jgi:hypothetical protein
MKTKFLLSSLILFLGACGYDSGSPPAVESEAKQHNYRVIEAPKNPHDLTAFPPSSKPWELHYKFIVPPLPNSKNYNPENSELYIWGDVDFDSYGAKRKFQISNYIYNQIVPQLMMGNVFADNKPDYTPILYTYKSWVIEAQYYWMNANGESFDKAGPAVSVSPGEVVTTVIKYIPEDGTIEARIFTMKAESRLILYAPFPNEPGLFRNWRDFFEQAETKSGSAVVGQAVINVESHNVDEDSICSLLPFNILEMSGALFPKFSSGFYTRTEDNLSCPTAVVRTEF